MHKLSHTINYQNSITTSFPGSSLYFEKQREDPGNEVEEYHWWTGVTFPFVHAVWTGTESLFVIDGHLKTTDVGGNVSF